MINKNYKNYTIGFVLKNTIIILFFKIIYEHILRAINGQSSTSNIMHVLHFEIEGVYLFDLCNGNHVQTQYL